MMPTIHFPTWASWLCAVAIFIGFVLCPAMLAAQNPTQHSAPVALVQQNQTLTPVPSPELAQRLDAVFNPDIVRLRYQDTLRMSVGFHFCQANPWIRACNSSRRQPSFHEVSDPVGRRLVTAEELPRVHTLESMLCLNNHGRARPFSAVCRLEDGTLWSTNHFPCVNGTFSLANIWPRGCEGKRIYTHEERWVDIDRTPMLTPDEIFMSFADLIRDTHSMEEFAWVQTRMADRLANIRPSTNALEAYNSAIRNKTAELRTAQANEIASLNAELLNEGRTVAQLRNEHARLTAAYANLDDERMSLSTTIIGLIAALIILYVATRIEVRRIKHRTLGPLLQENGALEKANKALEGRVAHMDRLALALQANVKALQTQRGEDEKVSTQRLKDLLAENAVLCEAQELHEAVLQTKDELTKSLRAQLAAAEDRAKHLGAHSIALYGIFNGIREQRGGQLATLDAETFPALVLDLITGRDRVVREKNAEVLRLRQEAEACLAHRIAITEVVFRLNGYMHLLPESDPTKGARAEFNALYSLLDRASRAPEVPVARPRPAVTREMAGPAATPHTPTPYSATPSAGYGPDASPPHAPHVPTMRPVGPPDAPSSLEDLARLVDGGQPSSAPKLADASGTPCETPTPALGPGAIGANNPTVQEGQESDSGVRERPGVHSLFTDEPEPGSALPRVG
ncbi:MAG: hypothetical protein WCV84_05840 [Patescibacteria group bacterium]